MSKRIDISNKVFGKLTVLYFVEAKNTHAMWMVRCTCGSVIKVSYSNLKSKQTNSCQKCGNTTHGLTGTKYYRKYLSLREREKGNVDESWSSFTSFMTDTYSSYLEGYRLQVKDRNKPLSKKNCHWLTQKNKFGQNQIIEFI